MKTGKIQENQPSTLTPEILSIIHGLNNHFGKLYCFPSQFKIIELMNDRYSVERSIRTINRQLKKMERQNLITRTRRIKLDPHKGLMFKSTLYKITLKGYELLRRLGLKVWKQINILKNIIKSQTQWPDLGKEKEPTKTDLSPLKDILGVLKLPGFT